MIRFIKEYWKTLLFFGVAGLFGGFFMGLYVLDGYSEELKQQLIESINAAGLGQFPVDILLGVITALQSASYGVILGAIGIIFGKKTGLWKDERSFKMIPLTLTLIVAVVGGLVMILPDILFFNNHFDAIRDSYATKPSVPYILASVVYGGVIEEVMLRLFWMSLAAFALWKIFARESDVPTMGVLICANVISALLFAAGHLPATFQMLGSEPLIIVRCMLLNGGIGLVFGYLYRKFGLRYAMIAHAGCHVVSKLIWILFI